MPSLDVRAKQAQEALFPRYDRLNELWEVAEKKMAEWHVPRGASYHLPWDDHESAEYNTLSYDRHCGKWRIFYNRHSHVDPQWGESKLIKDCSADLRVALVKYLPKLREAVVESAETFVTEVDEAIATMRQELATMNQEHMNALLAERAKLNGQV